MRGDLGRVQNNLDGLGTDFQKLSVTVDNNHKVLLDAIAKLTASMQLGTRGDAGSVHFPYEPHDETDAEVAARRQCEDELRQRQLDEQAHVWEAAQQCRVVLRSQRVTLHKGAAVTSAQEEAVLAWAPTMASMMAPIEALMGVPTMAPMEKVVATATLTTMATSPCSTTI